jgi:hypothetical protein
LLQNLKVPDNLIEGFVRQLLFRVNGSHFEKTQDVNLKPFEDLIVPMNPIGLLSFKTQEGILEARKAAPMDISKRNIRQESLKLEAELKNQNPEPRQLRARFDHLPSAKENITTAA